MYRISLTLLIAAGAVSSQPVALQSVPTPMEMRVVTEKLICLCSCNSLLADCPHDVCSFRDKAKSGIAQLMMKDVPTDSILAIYVNLHGEIILSSPAATGFNLLVWILPFAGGLVGMVVMGVTLRSWTRRNGTVGKDGSTETQRLDSDLTDEQQKRIDDELSKLD